MERILAGKRVRRVLPAGGRLHIDRPLPFLCLYRQPPHTEDVGTADLVQGEASFIISAGGNRSPQSVTDLVSRIADAMSQKFGAFLIIEIWSAPDQDVADAADRDDIEPTELRPDFVLSTRGPNPPLRTLEAFRKNLQRVSILKQLATVQTDLTIDAHPTGMKPVLTSRHAKRIDCQSIGLCVRPIYRDHLTSELFPIILRSLKRGLSRSLKHAMFTFAKTRTTTKPAHYWSLGRRAMVKAVWEVDQRLSDISDTFDFLVQVTPVNSEAAWHEFRRVKFQSAPRFYYPPLAVEPELLKRRLYEVRTENIEDPTLGDLFRQRQDELDRKITMLTDIGTPRFVLGSRQVFGDVHADLLTLAQDLLASIPVRDRADAGNRTLTSEEFAKMAQAEIDHYRSRLPTFAAKAIVNKNMFSGLICSGGNLLIGHKTEVQQNQAQGLLHHEVGTHLLTYYNGLAEPFRQLHAGFAGYDALQEGLAVLSEYLVGQLSSRRMRMLAARVLAVHMLIEGATFIETFRTLDLNHRFSQRIAYMITMRTYRGGGLTKDAVYLKGLAEILKYLAADGELDPLFVGKIAVDHIPLIQELRHRKILDPPVLRPRYLDLPIVNERLNELREGRSVNDLITIK